MTTLTDHQLLMSIKDLSLSARRTIDGFMAGINKSKVRGPGLEFSQYRSYQPGDDLRWLDWKRYARSDRYYIRESEIETSISVRFLIDASRSMDHRDGGFRKIEYARYLAATLGWLAFSQGDSLGLYVFRAGEVFSLPSRNDPQHLSRFFHHLENLDPQGTMGDPTHYKNIFTTNTKRELLVFITDLYEQDDEITRLLEMLASLRHDIIVLHVMGGNEMDMDFSGFSRLEDLETREQVSLTGVEGLEKYRDSLQRWLSSVRLRLLDKQIDYQLMRMDEPLDQALRNFLKHRQQINR